VRRRTLGRERLQEFSDEYPCVFVLSTGRTGTQTLSALLDLVGNVFAYHEPRPKLYGLSELSYRYSDDSHMHEVLREAFLVARRELMDYSLHCGKGYVETSPQATFLAPVILEAVPSVRFIHLMRDPRYVVRSAMRRGWYQGDEVDRAVITPRPDSELSQRWECYTAFQKNLWLWAETNRWIHRFSSGLPPERRLLVHSEHVFTAREETMERLFAFVRSPTPPRRRIMRLLEKKLNAQITGSFPEPSGWSDAMRSELSAIAGRTAQILGYGSGL